MVTGEAPLHYVRSLAVTVELIRRGDNIFARTKPGAFIFRVPKQ